MEFCRSIFTAKVHSLELTSQDWTSKMFKGFIRTVYITFQSTRGKEKKQ